MVETLTDPLLHFFLDNLKMASSRCKGRMALTRPGVIWVARVVRAGWHGLLGIPEARVPVQAALSEPQSPPL